MYEQTTYETCLACCLFHKAGIEPTRELEIEAINHSMRFSKYDFVGGHLDYMKSRFSFSSERMQGDAVSIVVVDSVADKHPTVYVDSYCLFGEIHMPHFITVLGNDGDSYLVYDPWDGKKKRLSRAQLSEGMDLLKDYIRLVPHIIL